MERIGLNEINVDGSAAAPWDGNFIKKILKFFFWAFIIWGIWFFLTDVLGKYSSINEKSFGLFWNHRYWLIIHIVGGSICLLTGPLQFFARLRWKYRGIHRLLGLLYVFGVGAGAVGSIYLSTHSVVGWMNGTTFFTITIAWIVSTAMGVISIYNGRQTAHRLWMIRSYLVTFGFVVFRLLTMTPLFAGARMDERFATLGWLSFILPLGISELCFQWKNSLAVPVKTRNLRPAAGYGE